MLNMKYNVYPKRKNSRERSIGAVGRPFKLYHLAQVCQTIYHDIYHKTQKLSQIFLLFYLIQMSSLTKFKLVNRCKKENDPKVKERLLLIIKVRQDKQIPFRIVKEMHRSSHGLLIG